MLKRHGGSGPCFDDELLEETIPDVQLGIANGGVNLPVVDVDDEEVGRASAFENVVNEQT